MAGLLRRESGVPLPQLSRIAEAREFFGGAFEGPSDTIAKAPCPLSRRTRIFRPQMIERADKVAQGYIR